MQLVFRVNTKLCLNLDNPDGSLVSNESHQSLADVFQFVVFMQQFDMSFDDLVRCGHDVCLGRLVAFAICPSI